MKFGIGQPMRRYEDLRLVTSRGRYTDDVTLSEHGVCLRAARAGRDGVLQDDDQIKK